MGFLRLGVLVWISFILVGAQVRVKKSEAVILEEPKKESKTLKTVPEGTLLNLDGSARHGMYWKVTGGYVNVLDVRKEESAAREEDSLAAAIQKDHETKSKENSVRSRSAVMGVRGLDDEGDLSKVGSLAPKLDKVDAMEAHRGNAMKDVGGMEEKVFSEIESKVK
jgi:hypothetical protein